MSAVLIHLTVNCLNKMGRPKKHLEIPVLTDADYVAFWEQVDIRGDDECWLWTGLVNRARMSYGKAKVGNRYYTAHRVAWRSFNEAPVPAGKLIAHRCDTPLCCNPSHLFVATHAENIHDMFLKHRNADLKGSKHPNAKLDEAKVAYIRRVSKSVPARVLAAQFGVTPSLVNMVITRTIWKHVDGVGTAYRARGEAHPRARLTEDDVRSIRAAYETTTAKVLGEKYRISPGTVCAIVARKIWACVS